MAETPQTDPTFGNIIPVSDAPICEKHQMRMRRIGLTVECRKCNEEKHETEDRGARFSSTEC